MTVQKSKIGQDKQNIFIEADGQSDSGPPMVLNQMVANHPRYFNYYMSMIKMRLTVLGRLIK